MFRADTTEILNLPYVYQNEYLTGETLIDLNRVAYLVVSETISHGSINEIHQLIYDDTSTLYQFMRNMHITHRRVLGSHIETVIFDGRGNELLIEDIMRDMDEKRAFVEGLKALGHAEILMWVNGLTVMVRKE